MSGVLISGTARKILLLEGVPTAALPATSPARAEWLRRLGLVAVSIVLCLGALELLLRATSGNLFAWPNYVLQSREVLTGFQTLQYLHDDTLGYVPRPGYATPKGYNAPDIRFDAEGFRIAGDGPAPGGPPILAVGDSYTFGEEVNNGETWPALLQARTGARVLNAGVAGYGFDQIVLRAERLAPQVRPAAIVVSFIADDLRRTEKSRLWSADKPWFDLDKGIGGNGLVLRGVPVPPRTDPRRTLTLAQRVFGYSYLVDFVLRRLSLMEDWFGDHVRVHPAGMGEEIGCRLTARLRTLRDTSGVPMLLVAQYDPFIFKDAAFGAEQRRLTGHILDCARRQGIAVLDTFDAVAGHKGDGGPLGLYAQWHMNGAGNSLVADGIAAALKAKR
jgi:lysophospholipase L1-like esterase